MNTLLQIGVVVAVAFLGVCGYWFMKPHTAPRILRDNMSGFEIASPTSPMKNFRPPQF